MLCAVALSSSISRAERDLVKAEMLESRDHKMREPEHDVRSAMIG
jgi:hypothetical protein